MQTDECGSFMNAGNDKAGGREGSLGSVDLEKLLEQREYLDELIQKRFTKVITIMFTDMKGSTSIAESEGDMISRILIKKHNDIVFPIIERNRGVLVKTMGDGTLSYFETAADAVRSAVQIQTGIEDFNNRSRKTGPPLQVRIGLNTGTGIVEKHDIFGDVVNVASRFESQAGPGEIYMSENTYEAVSDKDEFYCKFIKTTTLKNKSGTYKIFKVFWNKAEIEKDKALGELAAGQSAVPELIAPAGEPGASPGSAGSETAGEAGALQTARDLEKKVELIK
ncbi:MAG TPA: adenylate/guanylate cyclase domain-containing protein, partial [Thermodesulfovibrionales bacterium]|nr:adenylate/guanylate cyclase domain-containing protein [Thermodesulfovibrionales bacterium]